LELNIISDKFELMRNLDKYYTHFFY